MTEEKLLLANALRRKITRLEQALYYTNILVVAIDRGEGLEEVLTADETNLLEIEPFLQNKLTKLRSEFENL